MILTNTTVFPVQCLTELGDPATIVGHDHGSYYGFVLEFGRPGRQTLMRWNSEGLALDAYGDPIRAINWNLKENIS